ncbi:uncharacterized protein EI97DRAFT_384051 [Westerdykella ornata]|uniref:Uncharacterized protein n=1 Tax=Westerdykella ornata TaxID=318751 RepID=A0A6A6J9Z1_WESOR|nr:uncharacterized protein EI97DRAFT_384051 [Westerdykella ornata]KAF2273212.1 hypothetical protein EI97DRAFT_384051 [Westerdykella ornata]
MGYLSHNATAEEARTTAGMGLAEWGRFLAITREEGRAIAEAHPTWSWADVPAREKANVHARVNAQLLEEGAPQVGEDIIRWRMAISVRAFLNLKSIYSFFLSL